MDTPLVKRAYNLGLKAVPNFVTLTEEEISWYEQHLDELQTAISRGFVLPSLEVKLTPTSTTIEFIQDLNFWLDKTQEFTKKLLGVEVNLRELFAIPEELPWQSVIPVFDPGNLTNRNAIQKVIKASGLTVWEEVDVMKYSGSEANKEPSLHFIENSVRPNADTMGMSPDQLVATGKNWLGLRGYALAFALHHFATGEYLDPQTLTWFPSTHLASGKVALGNWFSGNHWVGFYWNDSDNRYDYSGSRLAIPVPLNL